MLSLVENDASYKLQVSVFIKCSPSYCKQLCVRALRLADFRACDWSVGSKHGFSLVETEFFIGGMTGVAEVNCHLETEGS